MSRQRTDADLDALKQMYTHFDQVPPEGRATWRQAFFTQRVVVPRAAFATQQSVHMHMVPVARPVRRPLPAGLDTPPGLALRPGEGHLGDGRTAIVAVDATHPEACCLAALIHLAFCAELGIIFDPPSNRPEALASRRGDGYLFALRSRRVVGMLALEHVRPAALLRLATDGTTVDRPACSLAPYTREERIPVVTMAWVAPNRRGTGIGVLLLNAACRLLNAEPARVLTQLPFSPGGLALAHRVCGDRFCAAAPECIVMSHPLDELGSVPPPDCTLDIDLTADQFAALWDSPHADGDGGSGPSLAHPLTKNAPFPAGALASSPA